MADHSRPSQTRPVVLGSAPHRTRGASPASMSAINSPSKRKGGKTALDLSGKKLSSLDPLCSEATHDSAESLDASNNFLRTIPTILGASFPVLTQLDLTKNALADVPTALFTLTRLTRLSLASNEITVLPPDIGQLTALRKLNVSKNQLRLIPATLAQLTLLENLNLSDNLLLLIPPALVALQKTITTFKLENNPLISPPVFAASKPEALWTYLDRECDLARAPRVRYLAKSPTATWLARYAEYDSKWGRLFGELFANQPPQLVFRVAYSVAQQQNFRAYQEDRFVCIPAADMKVVRSAERLTGYYPPIWDDLPRLRLKEMAVQDATAEDNREQNGEAGDDLKESYLKNLEKQKKEKQKLQKDGTWKERDDEESIEEQRQHIAKDVDWHRTILAQRYPLHLDSRSYTPPAARRSPSPVPKKKADKDEKVAEEKEGGEEGEEEETVGYYAIYDGHGGDHCSDYLEHNLHVNLFNQKDKVRAGDWEGALTAAFAETEAAFLAEARRRDFQAGSTACVVLMAGDRLLVANAGDSRAVLCRRDKAVALTRDHKPTLKDEKRRIEEAGGFVESSQRTGYTSRVNGILAMSRSFGDIQLKEPIPAVIAVPELQSETLGPDDQFLILASDGLFDAMTNQEAVDFVRKCTDKYHVAQELVEKAMFNSKDNVSVMVVWLHWGLTSHAKAGLPQVAALRTTTTKRGRAQSTLSEGNLRVSEPSIPSLDEDDKDKEDTRSEGEQPRKPEPPRDKKKEKKDSKRRLFISSASSPNMSVAAASAVEAKHEKEKGEREKTEKEKW